VLISNNKIHSIKENSIIKSSDDKASDIKDKVFLSSPRDYYSQEDPFAEVLKETLKRDKEARENVIEKPSGPAGRQPVLKKALEDILRTFKSIKTFPCDKFIYPSMKDMTPEELAFFENVLDRLPLKDIIHTDYIAMTEPGVVDYAGLTVWPEGGPYIDLVRESVNKSAEWGSKVLSHEVGHTIITPGEFDSIPHREIWGRGPFITAYASTKPREDFAESYAEYFTNPENLKEKCPEKYAYLQELEKSNLLQQLIDNKPFRETGKYLRDLLDKYPALPQGMEVAGKVMGVIQICKGLGEISCGKKSNDAKLQMEGLLDLLAGCCFASKVFCVIGMALEGTKMELSRAIDKKEITAEQANAAVQSTVGVVAGPVANVIVSLISKLPAHRPHEIDSIALENLSQQLPEHKLDVISRMIDKEFTGKELRKALGKSGFTEEEINLIKECTGKEIKNGKEPVRDYRVSARMLEDLRGEIPHEKLDRMGSLTDKDFTGKELEKTLKKLRFEKDEIAFIKSFAEDMDKQSLSLKAPLSIAAGGAAGATAGGLVGPYVGVLAGFTVAGPVGGIVGLALGALTGIKAGSRLGGEVGKLVCRI